MRALTVLSLSLVFVAQTASSISKLDTFLQGHGSIINPTIVGGSEAIPHSIPYQVALFIKPINSNQTYFCGGSCISPSHVLTAAHCVDGAREVLAIFGAHNISKRDSTWQEKFSTVLLPHPGWNSKTLMNDLAIIVLPTPVQLNDAVQTVGLPKSSDRFRILDLKLSSVSGWGRPSDAISYVSDVLRFVHRRILPFFKCLIWYGSASFGKNQLCVDGSFGKGPCNGDSGGPLVIVENGVKIQHGLVSYGIRYGCEKGFPTVFTRVSNYIDWIQKTIGNG